jgi:hypothetical protein
VDLDYYSVVPNVSATTSRLFNNVKITADVSGLNPGDQVVFTAVWTCECPDGTRHISYGEVIGTV